VADLSAAEVEDLAVGARAWRPVGEVVERHHAADHAVGDLGPGCGGEPLIHRATLVGLDVAEGDPPQTIHGHDALHGFEHKREHRPRPGVKQQRLVGVDEELVEGKPGWGSNIGHPGRDPVDALGNFVDSGGDQNRTLWLNRTLSSELPNLRTRYASDIGICSSNPHLLSTAKTCYPLGGHPLPAAATTLSSTLILHGVRSS
jgi:hypothetical protein